MRSRWLTTVLLAPTLAVPLLCDTGQAASPSDKGNDAAVPVTVALAQHRDLPVTLKGLGLVQAQQLVSVHPQVDGQLLKVLFREGQTVHAGDALGEIDARSYRAALDIALARKAQDEALLRNAQADVKRNSELVEKNFISPQQYDALVAKVNQLSATLKGDDAAIKVAQLQVDYTTIRAPIGGIVGIRRVDVGNIVHGMDMSHGSSGSESAPSGGATDTLVVITQVQPISVVFTLSQDHLPALLRSRGNGQLAVDVFAHNQALPLDHGQLEVIDNQVDPTSGMVRLKATLPNAQGLLWPGQAITAQLTLGNHTQAISVPTQAVQHGPKGDYVYVVKDDSTVEVRPVAVGLDDGALSELLSGVRDGETVVTAGHYRLRPGVKVAATVAPDTTASLSPAASSSKATP